MKIDKNIPLPPATKGRRGRREPTSVFAEMEVGDSIFFPGPPSHVSSLAQSHAIRYSKVFVSRVVVEGGVRGKRVWRTR